MAGNSQVLREFLVAVGFKVDAGSYKDFQSKYKNTIEQFEKLGKVAAIAATSMAAIGTAVLETASQISTLYYAAQRAGTSVESLMGVRFGGEQIGIGAEAMAGAVERMSSAIRSNPGMMAFFTQLGAKYVPGEGAQNFVRIIDKLAELNKQSPIMARQFGQALGIDEQMLNSIFANLPAFHKGIEDQRKMLASAGINADTFAKNSAEAMRNWNILLGHVEILADLFAIHLLPSVDRMVTFLTKALNFVISIDRATHGWSTTIGGIVAALGGVAATFETIGAVLGIGGGVSLGGAAAGAGTAGLLGVDAALGYKDVKSGAQLYQSYKQSGSFDSMIKGFEGFRDKLYRDIAGHLTIGYGHEVKPGEDFSGGITQQGAARLLALDTMAARDAVMRLVKVALNSNQMAALTDFAYNVGPTAFAGSTLLRKLNAGDYAGAAAELGRWDKAGGQVRAGLDTRRLGEQRLFNAPMVNQTTTIHVTGNDDPAATGREVASQQRQVNADLLRDMGAKVQ